MVSKDEVKGWMREVLAEVQKDSQPQRSRADVVKNNVDIVCADGECYAGVIKKAHDTMNFHCSDCGLPLPDEMVGDQGDSSTPCPNCGCEDCEEVDEETKLARALLGR